MPLDYQSPSPNRRLWRPSLSSRAVVLITVLAAALFIPWPDIYLTTREIDITTGRTRTVTKVLGLPPTIQVSETTFSAALTPADKDTIPNWKGIGCRPTSNLLGGRGPYELTTWGGAASQTHTLAGIWSVYNFSPDARRASALRLLSIWRTAGDPDAGDEYLHSLFDHQN